MTGMGERDPALGAFVDEVESYFRVMSRIPAPPDIDTANGLGWYAQSPSDTTTYATDPWISVSDIAVAYAAPTLVVDGTILSAEKCTIRVEAFLARKNRHEGAQRAGNILVVAVPSPTQ